MTPGRLALAAVLANAAFLTQPAPAADRPAPVAQTAEPEYTVEKFADVAYRSDPAADPVRHRLDVYAPKGGKERPVLFFVHGGAWRSGDKTMYAAVGEAFAKAGIVTVVTNYRLTPKVRHPGHAEDVARAFAWTHANAAKYGGDPKRVFAFGHSAGGHLVALLATDPAYLKAEGLTPAAVRGVVAVSGVYRILADAEVFRPAFGADEKACRAASPVAHVSAAHPPFLLAYADKDYPHLDAMAAEMHAALEKAKSPTELLKVAARNHITIITGVVDPADPLHRAVRAFVAATPVK